MTAMSPSICRRDLDFLLYEWLAAERLLREPRYAHLDRAALDAVLDAAQKLATERFSPFAAKLDAEEPRLERGRVSIIPELKEALDAYLAAGFLCAPFDLESGGLQFPYLISSAASSLFSAANGPALGYPMLTAAAANLLRAHGTPEQQRRYLKPLIEGRWFGTMCLSEPQAGSSLADVRTRATPQADGLFSMVGGKMWISGGEHELTENIVHLVLARIDGAPAGVQGLSLFIVPRYRVNEDGTLGAANGVRLVGLNHKMGCRGTVNTVLSFGDTPCVGELVGRPNEGLARMFHMMNEARIGVGLAAAASGYAAYRYALAYARQRLQGRRLAQRDPHRPPVAIIEHPDVRRMLLQQKAYVEGGLALCLYCARLVDEQATAPDATRREATRRLLELLTPIAKAWPAEFCLEANKLAIQVLGGYGYTRDYPLERLYRDNRLNAIHEGTNGIQALDLLGRKVPMHNGTAFEALLERMRDSARRAAAHDALSEPAHALATAVARIARTTETLLTAAAQGRVEPALGNAWLYLEMLGHAVVAWLWLEQALCAHAAQSTAPEADRAFYAGKLGACRYFFRYELPRAARHAELLERLDETCLTLATEAF